MTSDTSRRAGAPCGTPSQLQLSLLQVWMMKRSLVACSRPTWGNAQSPCIRVKTPDVGRTVGNRQHMQWFRDGY
eukprot:5057680-Lingulodinium_polyedra.AAC.1